MQTRTQPAAIRRALLGWYRNRARALPWRQTSDPYAIWVSEVMLQQTQVATVIPYYERFLRAFPTLERLARAPFEKVAAQWSGLGYYHRARRLHLAAQKALKDFGGRFPPDYQQARTLPGVGHYTACAVLSIAYRRPLPVLDGNVARVLARLHALDGNLQTAKFRRAVERDLQELIAVRKPGDFNQAIMELGETLCLPRCPRCAECPLRRWCQAFRRAVPESYPQPRARRAVELRHLAAAIIREGDKVALVRGHDEGLLDDLWNFPAAFGSSRGEAFERLKARAAASIHPAIRWGNVMSTVRHRITFRSIQVATYAASLPAAPQANSVRWFSLGQLPRAAVSKLVRKIAATACSRNS